MRYTRVYSSSSVPVFAVLNATVNKAIYLARITRSCGDDVCHNAACIDAI